MTRGLNILLVLAIVGVSHACRRPAERSGSSPETNLTVESQGPVLTPGAPTAQALGDMLGVPVDLASGETNQYLIRAARGSVDLSKVGTIHQDLGYAVGVTLPNGVQIGFRFEPLPPN